MDQIVEWSPNEGKQSFSDIKVAVAHGIFSCVLFFFISPYFYPFSVRVVILLCSIFLSLRLFREMQKVAVWSKSKFAAASCTVFLVLNIFLYVSLHGVDMLEIAVMSVFQGVIFVFTTFVLDILVSKWFKHFPTQKTIGTTLKQYRSIFYWSLGWTVFYLCFLFGAGGIVGSVSFLRPIVMTVLFYGSYSIFLLGALIIAYRSFKVGTFSTKENIIVSTVMATGYIPLLGFGIWQYLTCTGKFCQKIIVFFMPQYLFSEQWSFVKPLFSAGVFVNAAVFELFLFLFFWFCFFLLQKIKNSLSSNSSKSHEDTLVPTSGL